MDRCPFFLGGGMITKFKTDRALFPAPLPVVDDFPKGQAVRVASVKPRDAGRPVVSVRPKKRGR